MSQENKLQSSTPSQPWRNCRILGSPCKISHKYSLLNIVYIVASMNGSKFCFVLTFSEFCLFWLVSYVFGSSTPIAQLRCEVRSYACNCGCNLIYAMTLRRRCKHEVPAKYHFVWNNLLLQTFSTPSHSTPSRVSVTEWSVTEWNAWWSGVMEWCTAHYFPMTVCIKVFNVSLYISSSSHLVHKPCRKDLTKSAYVIWLASSMRRHKLKNVEYVMEWCTSYYCPIIIIPHNNCMHYGN